MKEIIPEQFGVRLDTWLSKNHPEESRSTWQKRIKDGEVCVNGKKTNPHYQLREKDQIQIDLKTPEPSSLKAENIPLEILYEDENYAIINKPAGLVVHPGAGHSRSTLVHAVLHHFKGKLSNTDSSRPGIIHRLDKDTSGILVIAKNNTTHRFIAKQFEEKTVQKEYIALVNGHLYPNQGSIDAPLNRNRANRKEISVTGRTGSRQALTHYKVKKRFKIPLECSLLSVQIETGRTHQIRVHMQAIEHPVLGDPTYGKRASNQFMQNMGLQHQFLHATKLAFISPTTQKKVTYKADLPKELQEILDQFI